MSKMGNYIMDIEEFCDGYFFGQPWRVTMLGNISKHNWEKCNYSIR